MESTATIVASDLEALIPIVGAATSQRLFFFNSNSLKSHLYLTHSHNTRTRTVAKEEQKDFA
jgi:hypothetical protein